MYRNLSIVRAVCMGKRVRFFIVDVPTRTRLRLAKLRANRATHPAQQNREGLSVQHPKQSRSVPWPGNVLHSIILNTLAG